MGIQAIAGTPISDQISFGLSIGGIAGTPSSSISNTCSQDWIEIPGVDTAAIAAIAVAAVTNGGRVCGRTLASTAGVLLTATVITNTVCARHLPFRVGVDFDNNERAPSAATTMAQLHEQQGSPAGIVGFKLTYFQVTC